MDAQVTVGAEDVQVAAKPRRRTYPGEYKRRILKEADACTTPGAIGALLRREGLYSSHRVVWRRARGRGELAALAPKQRGRKPAPVDPRDRKITELERQLAWISTDPNSPKFQGHHRQGLTSSIEASVRSTRAP